MGIQNSKFTSFLNETCKSCDKECGDFLKDYIKRNKEFCKFTKRFKKDPVFIQQYIQMEDEIIDDFILHPNYRKCLNTHVRCMQDSCKEGYDLLRDKVVKVLKDYYILKQMDKALKQPQDEKLKRIIRSLEYTSKVFDIDSKGLAKDAKEYFDSIKK